MALESWKDLLHEFGNSVRCSKCDLSREKLFSMGLHVAIVCPGRDTHAVWRSLNWEYPTPFDEPRT